MPRAATVKQETPPVDESKIFYHVYECRNPKCFEDENPQRYSSHLRAAHVAGDKPVTVHCPGCGNVMAPHGSHGRDLSPTGVRGLHQDKDGNLYHDKNEAIYKDGRFLQEAPGQPDQTDELAAEHANYGSEVTQ